MVRLIAIDVEAWFLLDRLATARRKHVGFSVPLGW